MVQVHVFVILLLSPADHNYYRLFYVMQMGRFHLLSWKQPEGRAHLYPPLSTGGHTKFIVYAYFLQSPIVMKAPRVLMPRWRH